MKYFLITLCHIVLSNYAIAGTIYVPTHYPTVQDGIDAATIGDTVILEVGTYYESNILMKYGVHLLGETGNPNDITIHATDTGSVVICRGFTGNAPTTIEGLTVTSSADSNICFGIWCEDCPNVIITNSVIRGNGNTGIISYNSSLLIEDNQIFNNGHVAVACYGDSSQAITIRRNTIHNNRNMYTGEGLGGAIYCSGIRLDLISNLIYNNRSGVGGGLFAIWCKSIYASNNTIANNRANEFAGGIVLVLESNDSALIENSILWADSVDEIFVIADSGAYYDIRNCDIMGGWEGETNFNLDPNFCDTAIGDFSLDLSSPCTKENNGSGLTIGALDVGCGYLCGDVDHNGAVDLLDITQLVSYFFMDGPTPYPLEASDVDSSGQIDILDLTYLITYMYQDGPVPVCP